MTEWRSPRLELQMKIPESPAQKAWIACEENIRKKIRPRILFGSYIIEDF